MIDWYSIQAGVEILLAPNATVTGSCFSGISHLPRQRLNFQCPPRTWKTKPGCFRLLRSNCVLHFTRLDCPQGWVRHGYLCYHVNDTPTLKWNDARTTCQNLGGDLAIIRSEDENNFITDLVMKQQPVPDLGAWIGLYRKNDTKFYWIDDTPLEGQYSAWASGEPNGLHTKCVHTLTALIKLGKWNDNYCGLPEGNRHGVPVILCQKKSIWGGHFSFWYFIFI